MFAIYAVSRPDQPAALGLPQRAETVSEAFRAQDAPTILKATFACCCGDALLACRLASATTYYSVFASGYGQASAHDT
jgi:hypothetical protein